MDFFELLKHRRSTRKFTGESISRENMSQILLAANSAPVGSNMYKDIHLTVVQNRELLDRLSEAAVKRFEDKRKMKAILGDMKPEAISPAVIRDPFYGATAAIFISHKNQTVQPGIEFANAACVAFLVHLAATELGLGSVFIWGVLEAMREIPELDNSSLLDLPDGFMPLLGVAIGYTAKDLSPRELKSERITVNYL
jgi:nitroreductase